ncbi:MAG: hypothetical protein WC782_13725 [Methylococcaceae bacterium]|jgi:hypothetical protein
MKLSLLVVLLINLAGCSTFLTRTSYSLEAGMPKQIVIGKMGLPERRSLRGNDEALEYSEIVGYGQCSYIIVWLSNGKVTAVTSRSGASVAGCGLGSKEIDWGQIPKPELNININTKGSQ